MKYNKKIVGALLVISFMVPQVMFASSTNLNAQDKFCNSLDKYLTSSEKKSSERETSYNLKLTNRESEKAKQRAENDKKKADKTAQALIKQDSRFNKILAKVSDGERKQAIVDFQTTVKNLVNARQTAIETAQNTFRNGVDQINSDHKTKLESALNTMRTAIETAVAKAKTDCASGINSATVKNTLKDSIKTARETFKTTVKNLPKISVSIKTLVDARKVAFEKAHNDFKSALEVAKTALKTKLGIQ